ncbi:uncharacterized protein LOC110764568 [Prunus avium]|uniref:non-specific serine/threonine protein kinase n=1 Tax=Prunus avium TaxID=42229 RepID=A0A6P5T7U3_PRUAV|nr:uncharacterized protein LOC110764568 [Prunus avium]
MHKICIQNKMEHSQTHSSQILFTFFLFLRWTTCLQSATLSTSGNESDRLALLDFKKRITQDPLYIMSSWNDSIDLCSWVGVTCNPATKRVMVLNLEAQKLVGSLSPSLGNLTFLTGINLRNNSFHGEIPQEIGRLLSLQHLNLSSNSFGGKIPFNISHCMQLTVLDLTSNKLFGSIPNQLSSLLNLVSLGLGRNNLTGTIPHWIGNFSSLEIFVLAANNFQGSIPNELGRLTNLRRFIVWDNNLSGMIPTSLYNISSIYYFAVTTNQLHGELPPNVGITLPNLEVFAGGVNKFTGTVPLSLSNASRLQVLDFAENGLTGPIPAENLATLQSLVRLNFGQNRLGSGKAGDLNFLSFPANCTSLEVLGLNDNHFGGELPASIANLSTQLKRLNLGTNLIHGSIPNGIGNLINFTFLGVAENYLGGSVPDVIGKLQKLQGVELFANQFSGPIPSSLGNLTSLTRLFMEENTFGGSIPPSFGNCKNLQILNLSSNNLNGTIPKEVIGLSSLSISLSISNNFLTGSLPSEVGDLKNIGELDISENKLSGEIPATLSSCISLERLHLQGNKLEGSIPLTLEMLRGLEEIDISRNNLSGKIPKFLGNLGSLKHLNISHNNFEGELPREGIFSNVSGVSILGNNRLCGGIPEFLLPACSSKKRHSPRGLLAPKVFIPITCALAFLIALSCSFAACSYVKKSRDRPVTSHSYTDWKSGVSYSQLLQATDGFSVDNLIGSGSFGSVYKGVLPTDGTVVAVKVLNLQQEGASKSFVYTRNKQPIRFGAVCGNSIKSTLYPEHMGTTEKTTFVPREGMPFGMPSGVSPAPAPYTPATNPPVTQATENAELLAQVVSLRHDMARMQEHNNLLSTRVEETQLLLNQQQTQNMPTDRSSESLQTPRRQKKGKKVAKATPAPSKQLVVPAPKNKPHVPKKVYSDCRHRLLEREVERHSERQQSPIRINARLDDPRLKNMGRKSPIRRIQVLESTAESDHEYTPSTNRSSPYRSATPTKFSEVNPARSQQRSAHQIAEEIPDRDPVIRLLLQRVQKMEDDRTRSQEPDWGRLRPGPFTERIRHSRQDRDVQPLRITPYTGVEDPLTHLHSFQSARDDEPLREYAARFSHEYSRCPNTDDRAAYDAFKSGLRSSHFRYLVHSSNWRTYDELMKQAAIHAKAEYFNSRAEPTSRQSEPVQRPSTAQASPYAPATQTAAYSESHKRKDAGSSQKGHSKKNKSRYGRDNYRAPLTAHNQGTEVFTLLNTSYEAVLLNENEIIPKSSFRKPNQQDGRDTGKFCRYHQQNSHNTEDCMSLRKIVERLIREGKLDQYIARPQQAPVPNANRQINMISTISGGLTLAGASNRSIKQYVRAAQYPQVLGIESSRHTKMPKVRWEPITFSEEEEEGIIYPHNDPMIIRADIAEFDVGRILIDNGSSVNVIFADAFKELGIDDSQVNRQLSPLLSFSGDLVQPIGSVSLPISFGTAPRRTMVYDQFLVVDCPTAYNVIVGRTALTPSSE